MEGKGKKLNCEREVRCRPQDSEGRAFFCGRKTRFSRFNRAERNANSEKKGGAFGIYFRKKGPVLIVQEKRAVAETIRNTQKKKGFFFERKVFVPITARLGSEARQCPREKTLGKEGKVPHPG